MILNETPVRTSKNFNANNIVLKDFEAPQEEKKFINRNIYINSDKKIMLLAESLEDSERLNDLYDDSKLLVTEFSKGDFKLKYGVGQEQTPNQPIRILAKESCNGAKVNLDFTFDEENNNLQDAIEIYAEKDSKLDVTINYIPSENLSEYCYHNAIIILTALENSVINVTIVNLLNNISDNLISFENKLLDNSKLNYTIVDFGGKNSITNYYSDLYGKNSDNQINTIYLGNEDQMFDLNYIAHCLGE